MESPRDLFSTTCAGVKSVAKESAPPLGRVGDFLGPFSLRRRSAACRSTVHNPILAAVVAQMMPSKPYNGFRLLCPPPLFQFHFFNPF
ncbi:unnamed protein product [Caenorhabditis auriculariae]|uniref:Uncharacterized protein n=1 Tax=Caenorhabditis auriculariae TaxID=2777116 RepID=A0A8S1HQX5_9PELO|nr:unnamed protein product [Caenorhabditis auriculariae]